VASSTYTVYHVLVVAQSFYCVLCSLTDSV